MSQLESLTNLVTYHLGQITENDSLKNWIILKSPVEGRGVFANCDLSPGDTIFVDHPLIAGPRLNDSIPLGCTVCDSSNKSLQVCDKGCGLLLCSEKCRSTAKHKAECELVLSWSRIPDSKDVDSRILSRNILPLRSLLLNEAQKNLLKELVGHDLPRDEVEVRFIKQHFSLTSQEELLLMHACRALNANAYEMTMLTEDKECVNLRGLFPMSALLNHACSPNTRTNFDANGKMFVKATTYIPEGSEIFTCYTGLLWGTPARRHHLQSTKKFMCDCFRCCDRTEFGTNLAALRCLNKACGGVMLPMDSLLYNSDWKCEQCDVQVTPSQVGSLQTALARLISSTPMDTPDAIDDFVTNHLIKFMPESNHVVLELKLKIVWATGVTEGYKWTEVSARWLFRVEETCREALATCEALRLGAAPLAARLHLQLHGCLLETLRRHLNDSSIAEKELSNLEKEVVSHLNKSNDILRGDVLAPSDLDTWTRLANESVKSLIDYVYKLN